MRSAPTGEGPITCVGITAWKRPIIRTYLLALGYSAVAFSRKLDSVDQDGALAFWSSTDPGSAKAPVIRIEDGFLRSRGLGSDFAWPYSLVVDHSGIYYDPQRPSDLETILEDSTFAPDELRRAADLRLAIIDQGVTKYSAGRAPLALDLPTDRAIILVPGQVEDDASVRTGGLGLHSNLDLLAQVRASCPDAFVIYRPHPDVMRGNRRGHVDPRAANGLANLILSTGEMVSLLDVVHEVHTLTSLAGFEALMRGIPVVTYGGPFYAGWGLTRDRVTFPRRTRRLTLDELVAGTLIRYPVYFDWMTGKLSAPEDVLRRLATGALPLRRRLRTRLYYHGRDLLRSLGLLPPPHPR